MPAAVADSSGSMQPDLLVPASHGAFFVAVVATGTGLPVPEDAVLLGAGVALAHGTLLWAPTLGLGLVGVLSGDLLLYAMGYSWGHRLVGHPRLARRFTAERLASAQRFFDRFGDGAIVLARFVMGARGAIYFLSGSLRRPFWRFLAIDALACLIQVPLLLWLGSLAGPHVDLVAARVGQARLALLGVLLAIGIAALALRRPRS